MDFGAGTVFLGGLLTFASPCVLPLIPIYLSVLLGGSVDDAQDTKSRFKLLLNATGFILGFLVVFVLLGLSASALGRFMIQYRQSLQAVGGLLVFFFGLKFLGLLKPEILSSERRFRFGSTSRLGPLGSAVIGFTFAFGWTPCIGPILGSVLTFTAVSTNSLAAGAWYLFVYGMGIALPLLIVAALAHKGVALLRKVARFLPKIEKATGAVLVVIALLMVTDNVGFLTFASEESSSSSISQRMSEGMRSEGTRGRSLSGRNTGAGDSAQAGQSAGTPGGTVTSSNEQCGADTTSCGVEQGPEGAEGEALGFVLDPEQLKKGPVVLEFLQPDCPACLKMVPVLQSLDHTCSGKGLAVESFDLSIPEHKAVARKFAVVGTPTLLFYDAEGQEVSRLVGYQEFEAIHRAVAVLMGEVCAEFSPLQ